MSDAYLKVKDNGAQGLALEREETDVSVSELKTYVDNGLVGDFVAITNDDIYSGYVDDDGTYKSNTAYRTFPYIITPGEYYSVKVTGGNYNPSTAKKISLIRFLDASYNVLGVNTVIEPNDAQIYTKIADIPKNTAEIDVCVSKAYVDTYGYPAVSVNKIESVKNKADIDKTIYAKQINPHYLSHRNINDYGLPASTTTNSWNLYKIDVSEIKHVKVKTYRTNTSSNLVMWSFVSTDFADVTATSETAATVVAIGEKYSATSDAIIKEIAVPAGAKTMFLACAAANVDNMSAVELDYGEFDFLSNAADIPDIKKTIRGLTVYSQSPYYRDVRWGCPQFSEYYHSEDDGSEIFFPSNSETNPTTAATYFEMLNELVGDYSGYVTINEMGLASDEATMMYYYVLNPTTNEDSEVYKRPKIILSAGQHGFEKTAVFGLYWFVKDLLETWEDNAFLSYLRNHVQLIIMPLLNPYGFDNDVYVNANGVNLNRNWDTSAWSSGTPGTTSYGGAEPLDQPETQYASEVIIANLDAVWLCDFHTNGSVAPSSQTGYLWHSFALVTYDDAYFAKMIQAAKWHIDEMSGHLYKNYSDYMGYGNSGHFTDNNAPSHQGLIVAYAREHNIMAATMEGGAAFIGDNTGSPDSGKGRWRPAIQHLNADLIGNWIRCLLAAFAHYAE